ncbi:MAG: GTPase Era [Candidatus Omnitrophota bacterium]
MDAVPAHHRSGYIALVGRPNAGKSTLLNQLLGTKLAAVTPHPQTTRNRIFGIFDRDDAQIVFQDTPGLLEPKDDLHQFMMREAERALDDSDLIVWLIDAIKGVTPRERAIAEKILLPVQAPLFIVFNKIDKTPMDRRASLQEGLKSLSFFQPPVLFYISALFGDGVRDLLQKMIERMPEGPKYFPPDQLSDRTQRFFVEEIIREKAFLIMRQEIPYSLAVQVEEMKEREGGLTAIRAVIHVERESQKGMILGKKGAVIKQIGTEARKDIEALLGNRAYLDLWVKVSERWRKKGERLRTFGYKE